MALRTNLFPYPSAETTLGWVGKANTSVTSVTDSVYVGTKSILFERTTSAGQVSGVFGTTTSSDPNADSFAVVAGEQYTFSAYVLGSTGNPQVEALLVFQTATAYQSFVTGSAVTTSGTWQRVSITGTVPAGAVKMGVELRSTSTSLNPGIRFYADAFMLEKSGSVGNYFDGSIVNNAGYGYAWTGTAHASASTESSARTNLMPYPSAEGATNYWAGNSGTDCTIQTTEAYVGAQSYRFYINSAGWVMQGRYGATTNTTTPAPTAQAFACTAGEAVTVSAWLKLVGGGPTMRISILWMSDTGYISRTDGDSSALFTNWKRYSATATAPAGATKFGLEISSTGTNAFGTWVSVDAILVEKSATLEDYFDGTMASGFTWIYGWTGTPHASSSTMVPYIPPTLTVLLQDSFDRANSTTVIGSPQIGPAPVVQNGVGGIISNQLYSSTIPLVATYDLGVTDVELSFTLVTATGGASVVFGYATGDYWYVYFTTTAVQVIQVPPSGSGVVMFGSTSKLPVNGSLCRAHLRGGTIRAYVDGVLVARWHPDAPITNTKHGVRINNTTARVDSLVGTDAPAITDDKPNGVPLDVSDNLLSADTADNPGYLYRGRDTKLQDEAAGA